jgi:tRNA pseudouridine-54 N-methylase
MRETQIYGLTAKAAKYIDRNAKREPCSPCPHCKKMTAERLIEHVWRDDHAAGLCDDGPQLRQWQMKDGCFVREEIQGTQWSSGPCIFLKLQQSADKGKTWADLKVGLWTDKEIEEAL